MSEGFVLPDPTTLEEAALVARIRRDLAEADRAEMDAEARQRRMEWQEADPDARGIQYISGIITEDTVSEWMYDLTRMTHRQDDIVLRITSPGGIVENGLALYDFLMALRADGVKVTTVGIGTTMSMGAVILQAGETRLLTANTSLMIHEVAALTMGKTSEIETELDYAKVLQARVLDILAKRAKMRKREISKRWSDDWYLSAKDAVALGFADKVGWA